MEHSGRTPNQVVLHLLVEFGCDTCVWVLDAGKEERRKGLVQLIDVTDIHTPMRRSPGNKRGWVTDEQIAEIVRSRKGRRARSSRRQTSAAGESGGRKKPFDSVRCRTLQYGSLPVPTGLATGIPPTACRWKGSSRPR